MAAGEDQPQPIIAFHGINAHGLSFELSELLSIASPASELVGRLAAGGRQQPGTRFLWNAVCRPVLDRLEQRLLDQLFRQVEVPQRPDQRRRQPASLLPENGGERGVGGGLGLDQRCGSPRSITGRTSTGPPLGDSLAIAIDSYSSATVTSA